MVEELLSRFDKSRNKTNPKIVKYPVEIRSTVGTDIFLECESVEIKRKFSWIKKQVFLIMMCNRHSSK